MNNNRVLVIYNSVDGATESYAQWIAGVLSADIVKYDDLIVKSLSNYDKVIFGACVRMGTITQLDKLRRKLRKYPNIELITFAVGMVRATANNIKYLANKNEFQAGDKLYYLKGEFNIMDRCRKSEVIVLTKVAANFKRSRVPLSSPEQYLLDCCTVPNDWRSPQNIKPIIAYIAPELLDKVDEIEFTPKEYSEYANVGNMEKEVLHYTISRK